MHVCVHVCVSAYVHACVCVSIENLAVQFNRNCCIIWACTRAMNLGVVHFVCLADVSQHAWLAVTYQ